MKLTQLHHGIHALDANYIQPGLAAVYLMVHKGRVSIVETGTSLCVPDVLTALQSLGLTADDVAYVIPTHIHLDHAGGAGALIRACSNASLVIHPRGAQHMISPEKLIAGTILVYGEERFTQLYGEIVPVPADRLIVANDGDSVEMNGRRLDFIDTPGHALHHFCVFDEMSSGIFTGDTFGIAYPHLTTAQGPYIFATTTPTQFDPDGLLDSIDKILARHPKYIYLTHFGEIELTPLVASQLKQSVKDQAQLALDLLGQPNDREPRLTAAINTLFVDRMLAQGGQETREFYRQQFNFDSKLNAQGLNVWLKRMEKASSGT